MSPIAGDDSYNALGNVNMSIAAPGVLGNDYLGLNPTATITASDTTSAKGGTVAVSADGSFTYDPPLGFAGSDTFHYTLSNSTGSSQATVTVTVSNRIGLWITPRAVLPVAMDAYRTVHQSFEFHLGKSRRRR